MVLRPLVIELGSSKLWCMRHFHLVWMREHVGMQKSPRVPSEFWFNDRLACVCLLSFILHSVQKTNELNKRCWHTDCIYNFITTSLRVSTLCASWRRGAVAVQAMVQQWCLLHAGSQCPSLQWWWCSKNPEVKQQRRGLPSQRGHRSLPSLLYRHQALHVWTWERNKILWNLYFGKLAIGSWNSFVHLRHCPGLGYSQTNQRHLTIIVWMFVNRNCSCQDLCIKGVSDCAALHCHSREFSSIWWPCEQWQSCLAVANHSMQVL